MILTLPFGRHFRGTFSYLRQSVRLYFTAKSLSPADCQNEKQLLIDGHELLTSESLLSSGCLKLNQPLTLTVDQGQQLNISLIDFEHDEHVNDDVVYGEITDKLLDQSVTYGSRSRQQHVMTSHGNFVDVTAAREARYAFDITGRLCSFFGYCQYYYCVPRPFTKL